MRTGSVVVPPWIQRLFGRAAMFACSWVSVIVTAPAIVSPVSCPALLSRGVEAFVVMSVENGLVTIDSAPHGPVEARDL